MASGFTRFTEMGGVPEALFGDGRGFDPIDIDDADDSLNTFISPGHGLRTGRTLFLAGTTLPAGVDTITRYYALVIDEDTFQVAATRGGAAVDLTSAGTPGDWTFVPDPVILPIEGDGYGLYSQPNYTEINRQVGSQEAPERLATAYGGQGGVRILLYPGNADAIFDRTIRRDVFGETDSSCTKHHTGLGDDTTLQFVGAKSGRITFSGERGGGNPDIIMSMDWRAQKDSPVANPDVPESPVLPDAEGYEFIRAFLDARDDTNTAPSDSLVTDALAFTIVIDQDLKEKGRKTDIKGSPENPRKMKSIVTDLNAGIMKVSGTFRINPSDSRYLDMVRDSTIGSLFVLGFHRSSRLLTTTSDVAAGATSLLLPLRGVAGSGSFAVTSALVLDSENTANVITVDGGAPHFLTINQAIRFSAGGGSLPGGGITAGTTYYVSATSFTATQFRISATRGGAAIDLTGADGANFAGSPVTFTSQSHGMRDGQAVTLFTTGTLPTGLLLNTTYYLRDVTTDTFALSLKKNGSVVVVSSAGTGGHTWIQSVGGAGGLVEGDAILFWTEGLAGAPDQAEVVTVTAISDLIVLNNAAINTSTDVITSTAHGLVDNQAVVISDLVTSTGLYTVLTYYVRDKTNDTFKLALTPGGTAVDIGGANGTVDVTSIGAVLTIQGRGAAGGTRYAWDKDLTNIYSVALEFNVPAFTVDTAPLGGSSADITSQEVSWTAEATTGSQPFLWALQGSSLYV